MLEMDKYELRALLHGLAGMFYWHEGIRFKNGYFELLQKDGRWETLPPPGRMTLRPKSETGQAWDKFALALMDQIEKESAGPLAAGWKELREKE